MTAIRLHWLHRRTQGATVYDLTDRLHRGRASRVSPDQIASTVSGWLADLDVESPLVDDFANAIRIGDWAAAHAFGDVLGIDVAVAV
jgi:hypothetical protein